LHVKGNTQHGKEAEANAHPLQALWQALLSQVQSRLRFLWVREDSKDARLQMGQEESAHD